jgi:hypothetical protein
VNRAIISLAAALLIATLVAAGTAVYAIAGHEPRGVQSATGCITNLHKLVKVALGDAPSSPCAAGQTQVHLAGGDITAVTAATGLNGGGTNGEAVLDLAGSFRLPQGCAADAVAKRSGPTDWVCAFAALGNQACPTGAVVTGLSATGTLICGRSITSQDGKWEVDVQNGAIFLRTDTGNLRLTSFGPGSFVVLESTPPLVILSLAPGGLSLGGGGPIQLNGSTIQILAQNSIKLARSSTDTCQPAARRGDAVVVNTQNGAGSIVNGSGLVSAC